MRKPERTSGNRELATGAVFALKYSLSVRDAPGTEDDMSNHRHLTLDERRSIERMLAGDNSLSEIARRLGRSKSTISRELLRNSGVKRTGAFGAPFNNCLNRHGCVRYRLCKKEDCKRQCCKGCKFCFGLCPDFGMQTCISLSEPPYVCNGCNLRHKCTLEKFVYVATEAHRTYAKTLTASRDGIAADTEEILRLDEIVSPLILRGQSIHVILENHKDEIMLDEKTVRNYVNKGLFTAKTLDLPNTVKMRPRKKKAKVKVERACREGRTYRDFLAFLNEHPDTPVVQIDTVEGAKGPGEPVLLTIHFVEAELMLAFMRDANTARSVIEIFDRLHGILGKDTFRTLFRLCLTDNGSEFTSPSALEFGPDGERRTRVFYTNPGAPYQKGACENNHSLIRRVIPKGASLKGYGQDDVNPLMNHINSHKRKKPNDRSPFDTSGFLHGPSVLEKLGVSRVDPDDVTLNPSPLKK
jgi:IS30 family transposase